MFLNFKTITGMAAAAVVVLATVASADARGRAGGAGTGEPDQTRVIVYGTPGNCPPTMAGCNNVERPKPVVGKRKYDPCGDFAIGSKAYRQCRRKK